MTKKLLNIGPNGLSYLLIDDFNNKNYLTSLFDKDSSTYPSNALYTESEANTMITTQDYIPVASASELDALRTTTSQTMGVGTPWEGTYTTGVDKKYLQVGNLDLSLFSNWVSFNEISGTIDGNELNISNLTTTNRAFIIQTTDAILKNINITNAEINSTSSSAILVFANDGVIENCNVGGTINSTSNVGGLVYDMQFGSIVNSHSNVEIYSDGQSYIGGFVGVILNRTGGGQNVLISDCSAYGNIGNSTNRINCDRVGGFIGYTSNLSTYNIENCEANLNIYADFNGVGTPNFRAIGGFGGELSEDEYSVTQKCKSLGLIDIINSDFENFGGYGGFVGRSNYAIIKNSYSSVNVYIEGSFTGDYRIGGFAGTNRRPTSLIENCYSIGLVSGPAGATLVGGFAGENNGTVTNSYWNTETSGQATSDGGTGKTTTEMKEGLIDDPDTDGIYVGWDDTIWDERTTSEYPVLQWETI